MDNNGRHASRIKATAQRFGRWLNSPAGRGVLKCSMAYTIASLATFASPLSSFLGKPGGKHVVATITVYFHPARSTGSMIEAIMIAIVAVAYAELVSLLSMTTSVLFGAVWGLTTLAHILVVVVFVGGGFGFMGWVKQKMGNPLVNVASTLASLAIISVVTKETAVIDNVFSNQKIVQVLKMLFMGIISTAAVNLLIWRVSARSLLRGSMAKVSTCLGDMLSMVTRGFVDGSEDDMALAEFSAASSAYSTLYPKMMTQLRESKFEHYFVGHEKLYEVERATVYSFESLAQSIGGLRSASSTLFALLKETIVEHPPSAQLEDEQSHFPVVTPAASPMRDDTEQVMLTVPPVCSPQDFFERFITSLRPPMAKLSTELCKKLREPCFGTNSCFETTNHSQSDDHVLMDAVSDFNTARSRALQELYQHPALRDSSSLKLQADLEQVAAACGHFTFSLQSFAEGIHKHLDALDDLRYVVEHGPRSWRWLCWWDMSTLRLGSSEEEGLIKPIKKSAVPRGIPDAMVHSRDTYGWKAAPGASKVVAMMSQGILNTARKMARDDSEYHHSSELT